MRGALDDLTAFEIAAAEVAASQGVLWDADGPNGATLPAAAAGRYPSSSFTMGS